MILHNLEKRGENITNYSFTYNYHNNSSDDFIVECYYKDGIYKEINKTTDGYIISTMWYNEQTKETINLYQNNLTYSTTNYNSMSLHSPFFKNNIGYVFFTTISSKEMNNEKCYLINESTKDYIIKRYINKETGTYLRHEHGSIVIEYTNFEINTLTNDDVKLPDLTGYTKIAQT